VLNNEGARHFLNQAFDKAEACYQKGYALDPENTSILNNLGLFYHQQKDYDQAILFFEKALEIAQKPHFLINIGNALAMKGEFELARNRFLACSEQFPEHQNAKISLAKLATHLKEFEKAAQYWQKIVSENPEGQFMEELAKVFMQLKQWEKAHELLVAIDPNTGEGEIWFMIGQCEFQLKNYGLAEKALKSALAEAPDNITFRHYLAMNYLAMGQVASGLDHLKKNHRLDPENPAVLTDIGVVYLSKGEQDTAADWLDKALELQPDFEKALHYKSLMKQMKSAKSGQN
jgi:tetratricopeptide (TPR) repeat protein